MKKTTKVYSASDFASAKTSVIIENSFWTLDSIDFTNVGAYSRAPLFELQLKQVTEASNDVPEGLTDMSAEMVPNRTFYVREGRPLYNKFAQIWEDLSGEADDVREAIMGKFRGGAFKGRVERLNGVSYTSTTKHGTVVARSRAEFWYPEYQDEGSIMDDFIYLCNKGIYTPIVEDKPVVVDPMLEKLKGLDPELIAFIKSMK